RAASASLIGEQLSCLLGTSIPVDFGISSDRGQREACPAGLRLAVRSPYTGLAPEDESEHETDPERGKDRFRRVLADVLLAVVLKTADATACIIPHPFCAAQIFIGRCARSRA